LLPDGKAIYVEAIGGDVLEKNPRLKAHRFQCFSIHQKELALSSRLSVGAPLQAGIGDGPNFAKFFHGQSLLR
jgi:hypothetical protein